MLRTAFSAGVSAMAFLMRMAFLYSRQISSISLICGAAGQTYISVWSHPIDLSIVAMPPLPHLVTFAARVDDDERDGGEDLVEDGLRLAELAAVEGAVRRLTSTEIHTTGSADTSVMPRRETSISCVS